ncbi:MAG: xanthine dehydrogenase family protein subunit M [Thermomicrobiales bacterium]
MRPFAYARPESIDEALARSGGDSVRFLAGGTDLLTLMKQEIATPDQLIDIKRLADLDDLVELTPEGLKIGALATLSQLQGDPLVRDTHPALAEAIEVAATPQLRNMATIGGNLLQRPRCWYFRNSLVHCWLKGGEECQAVEGENQHHALFGDSPCHATHPSDPATALLALDASLNLRGPGGERNVPLSEFFALPEDARRTENTLQPDELVVSILIPNRPPTAQSTYLKAMDRKAWSFALVGVAALLVMDDNQKIADARLVLGGVAPIPWRVPAAERLLIGASPSPSLFAQAAEVALEQAKPLSHNGYKIPLARTLIQRALEAAATPELVDD